MTQENENNLMDSRGKKNREGHLWAGRAASIGGKRLCSPPMKGKNVQTLLAFKRGMGEKIRAAAMLQEKKKKPSTPATAET